MDLKRLKKNAFILIVSAVLLAYNIGSFYVVAYKGVDIFAPSSNSIPPPEDINPEINVDRVINPPLGNETSLPNATTFFTLMVFTFPIEITIVFLAEILVGSILKTDRQRINFLRLLLLLGSALLLSVGSSVIHYTTVWPALHDIPIHSGHTFNQTVTLPNGTQVIEIIPQYGGAQTFFSFGIDVILLIVAIVIIIGLHFVVFKWIQKLKYSVSSLSLAIPALYYFIIWNSLARQITVNNFWEKTGNHFNLSLIFGLGFVLMAFMLILWNLTLAGTKPEEKQSHETEKYDEVSKKDE
ncbi:MAG: hypothetical protein JXA54_16535 [Candidatus Heimdallarchaeota archaeon]|nr:hypothetical protein [Candidatus Heimdallarchaeota archaeon]